MLAGGFKMVVLKTWIPKMVGFEKAGAPALNMTIFGIYFKFQKGMILKLVV